MRQASEAQVAEAREKAAEVQYALRQLQMSNGKTVAKLQRAEAQLAQLQRGSSSSKSTVSQAALLQE